MTKYVVNSGGIKNQPKLKQEFHREIVQSLGDAPKFLLCNFAQGREYWEPKFANYTKMIAEDMPQNVKPIFELALPAKFVEQCQSTDVIYFHGGDNDLLFYWMRKFDYLKLFKEKVVATNSASSDMLSASYWTCDWRECQDGFGVLPVKVIPHYKSDFGADDPRGPIDWDKAYEDLKAYGDQSLPLLALKEGEYKVFIT